MIEATKRLKILCQIWTD